MKEPKKTSYEEFEFTSTNDLFQKMVEDYIERETYLHKDAEGLYHCKLYADYRDELDDRTILEICQDADCIDKFYELISAAWDDAMWQENKDMTEAVCRYYAGFDFPEETDEGEFEEWVRDYIFKTVEFEIPYDHYLDQEVCADIFMDTGDGNYDFSLNTRSPASAWGCESGSIPDEASIVWLAKTQGHTKGQLRAALNADSYDAIPDEFLLSMRNEMTCVSSYMNTVAFLVKMSVRELLNLNVLIQQQKRDLGKDEHHYDARKKPYCGYVVLDKSTTTGLYDPWNGGGSYLDVELERDVKIPIKLIWEALPDINHDGRYGIRNVYSMTEKPWKETLKVIHKPLELNVSQI